MNQNNGDFYPLWGTCQGFQLMCILAAQNETVDFRYHFDSENLTLGLHFTSDASKSRMFSSLPKSVFHYLEDLPITANWVRLKWMSEIAATLRKKKKKTAKIKHHDGIPPSAFESSPQLAKIFRILSTNEDRANVTFVSAIEGNFYPFYGVQFHPERNQFEWNADEYFIHSPQAIVKFILLLFFFLSKV